MSDKDQLDTDRWMLEPGPLMTGHGNGPPAPPSSPPLTTDEKELARLSGIDFARGCYISCIQHVLKLSADRPNDPKVLHNKAVVEYYLSDFKRTDEFRKNLQHVCAQFGISLDNVDSLDDVEHCVYYFNQAVMLYHLRQYNAALAILDKVFQFVEPLEETLARSVCFLLLELYLRTYQAEKALGMVGFIENVLLDKSEKAEEDNLGGGNASTQQDMNEMCTMDEYKLRLQQLKTRCYLMLRSLKGCKREIKSLMSIAPMSPTTVYFKANLEYVRGNWRKAMKILNSVSSQAKSFAETGDNLSVLFYNNVGCIHFHLGRPNLGCFYFQKALQENDNTIRQLSKSDHGVNGRPVYTVGSNVRYELLYNLGVQLLHVKRPQEAFDCLIEAVQVYHTNSRLWLRLAECCIQVYKSDNEVDFHIKERKKDIVLSPVGTGSHRKIVLTPYISKPHQLSQEVHLAAMPLPTLEFSAICLRNALHLLPEDPPAPASTSGTTTATATATTPATPVSSPKLPEETETNTISDGNTLLGVHPGNPIKQSEVHALRCSILAASAYVALSIGDILMALHYAKTLLAQPKLTGVHKYLGHMYVGEALVLMDKISDAVHHLNVSNVKDLSFAVCHSTDKDQENKEKGSADESNATSAHDAAVRGWFPNSVPAARMIMQYNQTVAHTVSGELDKASDILRQLNSSAKAAGAEIPVQALMLAMYIQMKLGHADFAKTIVKQHCPQYR